MTEESALKMRVQHFWNEGSCGEVYASDNLQSDYYTSHSKKRYELEPYICNFARFNEGSNKDVLEIGVGMGADHLEWAKSKPKSLTGIDLTIRAITHTKKRFSLEGFESELKVADAEDLPFEDNSFDLIYSWGVLHHSPDTQQAINEVYRVLRPGGVARIMIYHKYSITGYMLWIRYALLKGRLNRSLNDIYGNYLESPGTKAFTQNETQKMLKKFSKIETNIQLSFGDLLEGAVGQKHHSKLLMVAKKIWPRYLIRKLFENHGLDLLVEAKK